MAVLVIVVMFLGRAFNDASAAFRRGATTVERNGGAQIALDRITTDFESLVISDHVACAVLRNTTDPSPGFGFDEVWFVTLQSGLSDKGAYEFARYYVQGRTNTFAGLQYITFRLVKDWWYYDTLRDHGVDPLTAGDREWWVKVKADAYTGLGWVSQDIILENIVRFDIWSVGLDGNPVNMDVPGFGPGFRSTIDAGNYGMGTYPIYLDFYIQATSDETMRQAGRIYHLFGVGASQRNQARAQMIRDSNVLVTRVYPMMAPGQRDHPLKYWY